MKIPFTLDAWLKDKSQKVETREGRPVKIISFEMTDTNDCPIAAQFRLCAGTPVVYLFDKEGHYKGEGDSDYDLFLITPEPELSEFEQEVRVCVRKNLTTCIKDRNGRERMSSTVFIGDDTAKKMAAELLELAKNEIYSHESLVEYAKKAKAEGKAEALNDLPRWRKWENGACGNGRWIPLAIVKRGLNGYELVDALGIQGEQYIMLSDLEKLPGFNE